MKMAVPPPPLQQDYSTPLFHSPHQYYSAPTQYDKPPGDPANFPPQNKGHNPKITSAAGHQPPVPLAPGFQAIVGACQKLYPEQQNPLQVSSLVKYWLGGSDPLDYVTVYSNNQEGSCYPHWHYVTCGLTDLHGDGRVHPPATSPLASSGHGFELTFRLRRREELVPPVWPVKVMQSIAKYVFETDNVLVPGDHITWSSCLGNSTILKHLLVADDAQLEPVITGPLGSFKFHQLICCTEDELRAVQRWNGPGILKLLEKSDVTGGHLLITDIERSHSLFEAVPQAKSAVEAGIVKEGSNLCGMAAFVTWSQLDINCSHGGHPQIKDENISDDKKDRSPLSDWTDLSSQCDQLSHNPLTAKIWYFPAQIQLTCNLETARYLPLCVLGRLKHGYHFTLKSVVSQDTAVTFLTEKVGGTQVSCEKPFAAQGDWLQLLIHTSELEHFYTKVACFESDQVCLPVRLQFPRFTITVVEDMDQLKS